MAKFITRVELRAGSSTDYVALHQAMLARGFLEDIQSADGRRFRLPTAMYYLEDAMTADQVRQIAQGIAEQTGKAFWVLVASFVEAAWFLTEVAP